jgi:enoyl-CoA hydratase/carnithine racemase
MGDGGETVRQERDGPVAVLTLANGARRNALSLPLRAALIAALERAFADRACRAIVLTGEGDHFCAGGDITGMTGLDAVAGRDRVLALGRIARLIVGGEKPVVAAVEGHAAGAGLSLAALCDIVVASRTARFTCSFNKLGLVPDLAASFVLPLRMGLGRAKLLMLSGRTLDAEAAERGGLVEIVAEAGQARAEALALAHELAAKAPLSNAYAKALLARMPRDLEEMLRAEADAQAILFTSQDFDEGRRAFGEKRAAVFEGR